MILRQKVATTGSSIWAVIKRGFPAIPDYARPLFLPSFKVQSAIQELNYVLSGRGCTWCFDDWMIVFRSRRRRSRASGSRIKAEAALDPVPLSFVQSPLPPLLEGCVRVRAVKQVGSVMSMSRTSFRFHNNPVRLPAPEFISATVLLSRGRSSGSAGIPESDMPLSPCSCSGAMTRVCREQFSHTAARRS